MSKLPKSKQFLDVSDYGRPLARWMAKGLVPTGIGPISVTWCFFAVGCFAVFCIFKEWYALAAVLLPIKSVLDAVDGELARLLRRPSYVGRYLDSNCDLVLNFMLFWVISFKAGIPFLFGFLTFCLFQLQGTVFNYYYVMQRLCLQGDQTSRLSEVRVPNAYPYESQFFVTLLHAVYLVFYGWQDWIITKLDGGKPKILPPGFMTAVSVVGLGFQLLVMAVLLVLYQLDWVLLVFCFGFTVYGMWLIFLRRVFF